MGTFFSIQAQEDKAIEELPGWVELPKTQVRLKIGGYAKFALIFDRLNGTV